MRKILFIIFGITLFLVNCTEDDLPINPYDAVNYDDNTIVVDTLSATSFVRLHKEVLAPSCNVLGCHDGTFEPDFRTVESSYNTMVYHSIVKNNLAEDFTYRVVPFDTAKSVLHERLTNCCFVNTDDRMPQDNIGNSLSQDDLNMVSNWIMDGAKDITGSTPTEPNNLPNVEFFFVMNATFDSTYSENRTEFYLPFLMPANQQVNFIFRVWDDKTNAEDMQINKMLLSEFQDDFSNSIDASSMYYDTNFDVWTIPFNTAVLQSGKTYYIRYEINDGENATNTIYPNNQTSFIFKSIWSFTVQ
ncbi:MAG: hypothetical protein H8E84_01270 [Flavobacteriales bacterium]|nr:hypothetical protein [Flavobacteriales bacterium]